MGYVTSGKTDTSDEAGDSMQPHLQRLENLVYAELIKEPGGLCTFELCRITGMVHQTISARITGLQIKGLVRDSGRKRFTPRKRRAKVWVATREIKLAVAA